MKCRLFFVLALSLVTCPLYGDPCTYQTWEWHKGLKKAVNHQRVAKNRAELTTEERGNIPGCSVCAEDQTPVTLQGLPPFSLCKVFAEKISHALEQAKQNGFPIHSLVGYRVGKSKGPLNSAGLRTEFSNHSYGAAIDINSEQNGLYDQCPIFTPTCRLIRGGSYHPNDQRVITPASILYQEMKKIGFRWGGELRGNQKDFMHFSPNGG